MVFLQDFLSPVMEESICEYYSYFLTFKFFEKEKKFSGPSLVEIRVSGTDLDPNPKIV